MEKIIKIGGENQKIEICWINEDENQTFENFTV